MPPKRKAAAQATKRLEKRAKREEEEDAALEEEENDELSPSSSSAAPKKSTPGVWKQENTCYILDSGENRAKIAAFDMDHTLIYPKSGAKFAKNRNDWAWLYPDVPKKLKELHDKEGYKVVIFTNQAGIEKKNTSAKDITNKILDLQQELGFPLQAFVAAATDHYRKPNTTMWKYLEQHSNGGVAIDRKNSFYCGDAAGRAKNWKPNKPKDFNCSDRAFAFNIGVKFYTPEEYFLKEEAADFAWDSVDPEEMVRKYSKAPLAVKLVPKGKQELVLLVGPPASGKSTFYRRNFGQDPNYVWINCDTLKTKDKCVKTAREALANGQSVVIDNTNPAKAVRAEYLALAKDAGVTARCFYLQTPVELAHHLNFYREKLVAVRRVPDVAYNMYKSKFEAPTTKEGFTEVTEVPFALVFDDDEHKKLFLERTC